MRVSQTVQPVSYELRLPDAVQAAALRLLDASREVVNATVAALWERLDDFGERETRYAYKQVTALIASSDPHGDRQWRCEAEQAGRILRGQAERKKQFALMLPLLEQGMILPKTKHTRAGKNRSAIKAALACLRDEHSDGGREVQLQGLIEQACNYYLAHGCFPDTYEDMQAFPVLKVGILPYAADDGGEHGQAHRLRLDPQGRCCSFAFRAPDQSGDWSPGWTEPQTLLPLPDPVVERLQAGDCLAPTLREVAETDGNRYAVLDSGGVDGRQAHTRRHIDRLKQKAAKLEARRDQFPVGDPRRDPSERKLAVLRREIACCWRKYEARNTDLAHLAANILILLASVWGADVIAGESLKSMKSEGRGRGAKGRWVHWRNNSQIRGALWHCLRYKCPLSGLHLAWQHAAGTTHTCPHCGKPVHTYASPALDAPVLDAGAWLRCFVCGWNGARDYAAAMNIAILGVAHLKHTLHSPPSPPDARPTMTQKGLNSESYTGSGLALRLPPTSPRGRLLESGKMFVNGWVTSVTLHSALPSETMLRLCG
jgi:putative transposase